MVMPGGKCVGTDLSNSSNRAQKKALIRYHPDRHHAAGMAAQVEAEELFKIVSKAPLPVAPAVKYPATRHPFPPRRR